MSGAASPERGHPLAELAGLAREFETRLADEGTDAITELLGRRAAALVRLRQALGLDAPGGPDGSPGDRRQAASIVRQALDLDRAIVANLEAEMTRVRTALSGLDGHRRTLASYRGAPARTPSFVDRVG